MAKPDPIVQEARQRLDRCIEVEGEMRTRAMRDVKFAFADRPEDQWDEDVINKRGDRPCYTYNRIGQAIDQVVNDQRQARPQIKVRGVDDQGDPDLADIYNGMIRNIEAISDAESVYDDSFEYTTSGGFGYWRVLPEYSDDQSFDQDLYIRPVEDQFSVYMDPYAQHVTKCDSDWAILTVWTSESAFEAEYPKADKVAFKSADVNAGRAEWYRKGEIRIAEYYRKVPTLVTLYEFKDGFMARSDDIDKIMDEIEAEHGEVKRKRDVRVTEVEWYKINGVETLEGAVTYRTRWIPVVRDAGKRIRLPDGERTKGITRDAMDAQRSYNYTRSDVVEDALMRPKAPVFLPSKTLENEAFRKVWKVAHKALFNYLPFVSDQALPNAGAPIPNTSTGMDPGKLAILQQDIDDIKATSGHFDPSLGAGEGNATSGVMLQRQQNQSGIAAFVYHDNHAKAIAQTGRILVELIPIIYTSERVVRILNRDLSEEFVRINANSEMKREPGKPRPVGNITKAKFDVTVDTGPSYATQRQEAADKMIDMGQSYPAIYEIGADIMLKGLDIPNADELIKRVRRRMIAQGLIEPNMDDPDEAQLVQAMQQSGGQQQMLEFLMASQAQEAQGQAMESQADVANKYAQAAENLQDAVAKALENMITARRIGVDPDGILRSMTGAQSTSLTNGGNQ